MKDGNFHVGIIAALFEEKHYLAMGDAIWLFGWLVHRQTRENGLVLGGKPVQYQQIVEETGFSIRSIQRWKAKLEAYPYIETRRTPYGLVWKVLKAKKRFAKSGNSEISTDTPHLVRDMPDVATLHTKSGVSNIRLAVDSKDSKKTKPTASPQPIPLKHQKAMQQLDLDSEKGKRNMDVLLGDLKRLAKEKAL